ncbi:MAG: hypothetical protein MZV63_01820 [Marinilabiliales bacterium]|nr:hypothetical protein [Marinilabiliales bacterium]
MMEAGRVKHHLANSISNPGQHRPCQWATVLLQPSAQGSSAERRRSQYTATGTR